MSNESPYQSILKERKRQTEKWGVQRHAWGWWAAILGEEYGEVCQEMLRNNFGEKQNLEELREELVQVAAVAVAIIEHVDALIEVQPEGNNVLLSPSFETVRSPRFEGVLVDDSDPLRDKEKW